MPTGPARWLSDPSGYTRVQQIKTRRLVMKSPPKGWQRFWWPKVDTPENAASADKNRGVAFDLIALEHDHLVDQAARALPTGPCQEYQRDRGPRENRSPNAYHPDS